MANAFIMTFGCQMNEHDSEMIGGMLQNAGYTLCRSAEEADLVVLNTCCVRNSAEERIYGRLGALKALKRQNPGLIIAVCGCMAQKNGTAEKIRNHYRYVDLVIGADRIVRLPELVEACRQAKVCVCAGSMESSSPFSADLSFQEIPPVRRHAVKAWVSVMTGCSNFCSYCIVPYVRGCESSREPGLILDEIRGLVEAGYREVTLLGQNVNAYGLDFAARGRETACSFSELLYAICRETKITRIRFMTSHPKDLNLALLQAMRDLAPVCPHLHLPLQSGSDRILEAMNRRYTREHYLELVRAARDIIPGIAITTDIIVGFPGETEEDFQQTMDLVEQVRFDTAYTFLFSPREGTQAATFPDQVAVSCMKERFERLKRVLDGISLEINRRLVGTTDIVLLEGPSTRDPEVMTGRTGSNKIVHSQEHSLKPGDLAKVEIVEARSFTLVGRYLKTCSCSRTVR